MLGQLFGNLFGKKTEEPEINDGKIVLRAPLTGKYVPITEVNDPVFSSEMLGKGVAIEPTEWTLVAPAAGTVTQLFSTSHAVTLQIGDAEVLLHIGLDTVNLQGKGFTALVKTDDKVKAGQPLVKFDPEVIKAAGYPLTTMMVVCNHDQFQSFKVVAPEQVSVGTTMVELAK